MPMKLEDAFRSPFDNRLPSSLLFNPKSVPRPEMTDYSLNGSENINLDRSYQLNELNRSLQLNETNTSQNENANVNANVNVNVNANPKISKDIKRNTKESFKISIVEHNELINNLMIYGTGGIIILLMLELISKINK
jgi:hypothetical protein